MSTLPALKGQSSPEDFRVTTLSGAPADLGQAVFPIVSQQVDGTFVAIGTGFFVAEQGVFVTAAHVLTEVMDRNGEPTAPLGLFQFLQGGKYQIRPFHRATRHPSADIAVGVATPMHHKSTKLPMPNGVLRIAADSPIIGSDITSYGYPKTRVEPGRPQRVKFTPGFYRGKIVDHFPNGRDRVLLPGNCYQTSMVIHGGASGGPVINQSGAVCAVNSTSYEDEELSFVTSITLALDLVITEIRLPGDESPRTTTLRELGERGFCRID